RLRPRAGLRSAEAAAQRTRVRSAQQQTRRHVESRRSKILDSVDTVANALIVQAPDDASAADLASIPGVKRVIPVHKVHMLLDPAVGVAKSTDAWNLIGLDRAGAGMKIAIIDSGIDSGHPGFQDASLPVPDSFPRTNVTTDMVFTNNKIIVARS